jgi:hypothetical protein
MKTLLAVLTVAIGLCVCGVAAAQQDLRSPDRVTPAPASTQDLRSPDQVAPTPVATQDLRAPDRVVGASAVVPAADVVEAAVAPSDGGIGTLWIVLMSVSGALVLAGAAWCATRLVRRRSHALT